jgi:predicted anti-sigma-YlaC factor YlaD
MRCPEAKAWLSTQRDGERELSQAQAVQEHLKQCNSCRTFEQKQREIDTVLGTLAPRKVVTVRAASVSTDNIMRAIKKQTQISQQLEDIQHQQRTRVERMKAVGAAGAALGFFTLSSIPLLFLAMTIIQTDLALKTLTLLNGFIDVLIITGEYLQTGLTLVTRDNWLLSGMAFAVVVMMGMWLRLMRTPQEV